ncbi:HDOD domain-containing protein [Candidatus Nitrotoga sp. BS]|uniref:HDOD domain-containing protein n=1 Tax=Candidatus Nitrotoga sp. BS TaxID=2890408 RepID=UPI001EF28800|nr:HDOD domain-containing protein [Candidatus Nitrotoga sp. BS]CAH1202023.1 HDOD domain-containing protein [Candidatus Nitrotoga sp. BS]
MSASSSPVNLKDAIQRLDTLPTMPAIAQKILALDLESDEGERTMLKLVEKDPQIAAKLIGLANTPLFGASRRVSSVTDASMLLGITRVKAVTLGIAVMSSMIKEPVGKLDAQGLWLHSLAISLAVRIISQAMPRNTRPLDDEIFLAGLLHDIGYMVLNYLDQKRSDELQTQFISQPDRPSAEIEAELLEMNHCELGAELARFWNLPESIIAVLRYHHDPDNELAAIGQPLVSMVNIAEKVLVAFGIPEHGPTEISPGEWQALGIDPSKADDLITQINKQAEEARQAAANLS